jgi:tRNA threonylcarbamoyladenosine biosynthesis protein TsaE
VIELVLTDEAATTALGARLAPLLARGDAVLLRGGLGAGKSTLARGLIRALTSPGEDVPSPTFTLVQTYAAEPPVAHLDLYRLEHASEVDELGLDDLLNDGAVVIEWPERMGAALPPDRLDIELRAEGGGRRAAVTGHGRWTGRESELE